MNGMIKGSLKNGIFGLPQKISLAVFFIFADLIFVMKHKYKYKIMKIRVS